MVRTNPLISTFLLFTRMFGPTRGGRVIEAHPWLAKLLGADSRKNAIGTAQGFGSGGIRRKSVA